VHRTDAILESRIANVYYRWVLGALWEQRVSLDVERWEVPVDSTGAPGEPVDVKVALDATYSPIARGTPWGPPWGTTWFRYSAVVPAALAGRPLDVQIDLGFDHNSPGFQAEGLIWEQHAEGDWRPRRGLHPRNNVVRVRDAAIEGERIEVLVEAASNPSIADGFPDPNSDVLTAPRTPRYTLGSAVVGVIDADAFDLHHDIHVCRGLLKTLPSGQPRRAEVLIALERCIDALDPADIRGTVSAARAELAGVLSRPAVPSAHNITAIGHAHMDSAWLWPVRETIRKCSRTFSNVLELMRDEPEFKFACSQAAQYEWMKDHYPTVFAGMQEAAERGQWIPVGGSWVEADGNVPGGEALLRQFVHGQRFFAEHFGVRCTEVWIPDVFGYPASMPQIYRLGGAERFLTQKLSWNRTNRFPHQTFWWEGIDGSRVFTHFPPVDTYNAMVDVEELAFSESNFLEHGRATQSLMPFGWGDGGGGPSPDMLHRFHRIRDLEGLPRVEIGTPEAFFDAAMAEYHDAPVWVGELYFEMHRGTYTSQARTKVGNRRCELALREAELWATAAYGGSPEAGYPLARLDRLWKTVLLNQFHDILPGSSIGWVHRVAEAEYAAVLADLDEVITDALGSLTSGSARPLLANPAPHPVDGVVVVDDVAGLTSELTQTLADGRVALSVHVPALGLAVAEPRPAAAPVVVGERSLDNGLLSVAFDDIGQVTSLVHSSSGRQTLAAGHAGSRWQLHPDHPIEYDAWDIEEYYRHRTIELDSVDRIEVIDAGPLVGRIRVTRTFGSSTLVETFELRAGSTRLDVVIDLDWQERKHLLKVAWPVDVATTDVVRDIQFGHIRTPIHTNTSWDTARFEICAHRWIDVGESGFGVAMLNDGRYGHDVTRLRLADGGTGTNLRLTVVKGAQFPDPQADVGRHTFTYAICPHAGPFRRAGIVAEGYRLNTPVRSIAADGGAFGEVVPPVVTVDHDGVIVEAVKAAEDGSGDLIVRLYESFGGKARTNVGFGGPVESVWLVNALEDGPPPEPAPGLGGLADGDSAALSESGQVVEVRLSPFQIATLRVRPG